MKQLLLILSLFFGFNATQAQGVMEVSVHTVSTKHIPSIIQRNFSAKYPKCYVREWDGESDSDIFVAEFDYNKRRNLAYFSSDGRWLYTTRYIRMSELPVAIQRATSRGKYRSWPISSILEVVTPDKGTIYQVNFEKGGEVDDFLYNDDGTLVENNSIE
ncbi:MAG: PepSY-like domain-containing protein [Hymenobacteraceae bacterium]|nr:PepSY-like domain-containing protein [Hymenobacteraceae bacterium]MDX5397983.1 PepSY-like domain-containing protein [Hymenobacteraceae bacterium]MDX5514055.1 PepSY-like domain-containing protein [Hymenobacteraceae bacterium]